MNVIFLDFDGVIDTNYYQTKEQMEEKIKILANICHKYNCNVVIEASAKNAIDEETLEVDPNGFVSFIFDCFKKYNINCIGRCPNVKKYYEHSNSYLSMWKEDEIRLYLFRHPEIEHYCIIDDDDLKQMHRKSDLDKVRDHLVLTKDFLRENKEEEGLQEYHIDEVGKILEKENNIRKLVLKKKK